MANRTILNREFIKMSKKRVIALATIKGIGGEYFSAGSELIAGKHVESGEVENFPFTKLPNGKMLRRNIQLLAFHKTCIRSFKLFVTHHHPLAVSG